MRRMLTACAVVLGLLIPLAALGTARGDVAAFQSARNRQIKHVSIKYTRVCPSCKEGEQAGQGIPGVASGTAKYTLTSYKILDQNRKFDFYLVDVSANLVKRHGDQDWGWMDVTVRSAGRTRVVSSAYTLGKGVENTSTCKTFPINLGVGFYGVSAGTTAGHVSFCHHGSKIESSRATRGRLYHATGDVLAVFQLVGSSPQGGHPAFSVKVRTNADTLQCPTLSDGTHCFVGHGMHGTHRTIGTTSQK